jgi:hypothetical protein
MVGMSPSSFQLFHLALSTTFQPHGLPSWQGPWVACCCSAYSSSCASSVSSGVPARARGDCVRLLSEGGGRARRVARVTALVRQTCLPRAAKRQAQRPDRAPGAGLATKSAAA